MASAHPSCIRSLNRARASLKRRSLLRADVNNNSKSADQPHLSYSRTSNPHLSCFQTFKMSIIQALSSIPTQGAQHHTPSNTPPQANKTYIIHSYNTNPAIALRGKRAGALQLHPLEGEPLTNTAAHWRCIENPRRWLGFRNVASDTYMGQNGA
ncbi:hypothetical protein BJX66DRAFT_338335 [Aspergillus keveii]|uniref:Uncharacterized protein n=1 Tax=Aspergillus keveii TaxID=714993 RepID=A0ABR4G4G1_9EURO